MRMGVAMRCGGIGRNWAARLNVKKPKVDSRGKGQRATSGDLFNRLDCFIEPLSRALNPKG